MPALDGSKVRVRIPAGTPTGRTFRVRGRGVRGGAADGDLLVTVEVQVPKHLNEEARAALAEFQTKAALPNPREHLLKVQR